MWAVTICNNIKEGTGERMEERKDEICEGCEVHEDLLKIVNETLPDFTIWLNYSKFLEIPPESVFCLYYLKLKYVYAILLKY